MASHLISSTQSSPGRMTIPALPLNFSRSAGTTPRVLSPNPEMNSIIENLGEMNITAGDGKVDSGKLAQDIATPPSNNAQIAIVVDDAGSPTRREVQLHGDDDIFDDTTAAPHNHTSVNPVAQRILSNLQAPFPEYQGLAPRPDRVSQVPTAANAQGIFPPDALIFVANLSTQRAEDQLEMSCHQTFDGYGPNHIKIRRDRNRHPFAFVQFENVDDANAAVSGAYGLILDGRKIRIERAKAERAVILSKPDGSMVTEAEARGVLERYGPLDLIAATNIPNHRAGGMSQAMFVRFAYYLDCRDALHLFDNHRSGFNLFMAPSLEPRFRFGPDGHAVVRGFAPPRSAVDQKSIYVGNLPEGVEKEDIQEYFSEFGQVLSANVMRKVYDGDVVNNFGFVEFAHPHEAMHAAAGERYFQGLKLRVEAKEYSARHQARVVAPTLQSQLATRRNSAVDNSTTINTNGRALNNGSRYNARGVGHVYNHAHPTSLNAYNPMTPPATVQYSPHGMQGKFYGTPLQQVVPPGFGIVTPPSQHSIEMSLNQMVPAGIFSPPPSHLTEAQHGYQGVSFGSGHVMHHTQGYQQGPGVYMPQSIPTIQETGEEGQY